MSSLPARPRFFYAVLNNIGAMSRVVHFLIKEKGLMVNAIGINEMHPGF